MPTRRINPRRLKQHRSYTIAELSACLDVHSNTVRHWQEAGLQALDKRRPLLFQGATVRDFLTKRNASRKHPCPPGTLYCLRCREARPPAQGMVDYVAVNDTSGNLHALCDHCEAMMRRRVRLADLPAKMPGLAVQIRQAPFSLSGRPLPSLNCDFERIAAP